MIKYEYSTKNLSKKQISLCAQLGCGTSPLNVEIGLYISLEK